MICVLGRKPKSHSPNKDMRGDISSLLDVGLYANNFKSKYGKNVWFLVEKLISMFQKSLLKNEENLFLLWGDKWGEGWTRDEQGGGLGPKGGVELVVGGLRGVKTNKEGGGGLQG